ncbi:hypothetical protein MLD59_07155 [Verrucomicrobiaceae bacterium E54]|nr:hypothetical protein [Verrucomicrobiaceae bacterium E54]
MHPRLPLLQGIALLTTLALPSHAADLFTEDFEDLTADENLFGDNSGGFAVTSNLQSVVRDENTSTVFGAPNQYVEFFDGNTTNGFQVQSAEYVQTANAVTTFQFDFYEPSGGGGDNLNVGFARGDINTSGSRARAFLNDGVVEGLSTTGTTSYDLDTVYTFYMILNDTDNPVAYGGGTLAANTADIWLQQSGGGAPFYAGSLAATGQKDPTNGYSVGFRTFNSDLQDVIVDNVSLYEGAAAIPEPSSVTLAGFTYDPSDGSAEVSLAGAPNTNYKLVEADDLDFSNPDLDPIPLTGASVGTLVGNEVTTDGSGNATVQFNLGTAKSATFLRAETAP